MATREPQNLKHLQVWLDKKKDKEGSIYVFLFPYWKAFLQDMLHKDWVCGSMERERGWILSGSVEDRHSFRRASGLAVILHVSEEMYFWQQSK